MSVWFREVVGWILLGLGVAAFVICYTHFLLQRWIIEAGMLATVGVFLFRGGMHLLKVATAARAAQDVRNEIAMSKPAPTRRVTSLTNIVPAGRPRHTVVPGPKANS